MAQPSSPAVLFDDMQLWWPLLETAPQLAVPARVVALPPGALDTLPALCAAIDRRYFAALRRSQGNVDVDELWAACNADKDPAVAALHAALVPLVADAPDGVFVRMSTRSAKDCLLKPTDGGSLRVTDAATATRMLCSSDRVASDVRRFAQSGGSLPQPAVVVRPFVRLVSWSELRVFVSEGTVTAISQYATNVVAPQPLVEFEGAVRALCGEVLERLPPAASVVIDVGMVADHGGGGGDDGATTWRVIELNPFGRATGGCHFSWGIDGDVLRNGPFEFRVTTGDSH